MHERWRAAQGRGASDAELVRIAFDHCNRMVYAVAHRILGSAYDAEDITQSVFEVFARRLHHIRDPARIPGFLKRCAVRTAVRQLRRTRWRQDRLVKVLGHGDDASDGEREAWSVRFALERLDPQERAAAVLKHVERHTHGEVARLLDVSPATARRRLASAQEKLREQLVA